MRRLLPLFLIVFIFLGSFRFFVSKVSAAPTLAYIYDPTLNDSYNADQDSRKQANPPAFGGAVANYTFNSLVYTLYRKTGGCNGAQDCVDQINHSALGSVTSAIGEVYNNPAASGIAYVEDTLKDAGFARPAYAQGIGFSALSTFLPFWKVTRNIAYSAIIIVMLIIGFMIIFRMKIDPKTVITIQAALPKIVVALLLITFSYAIAGFLIDIMYFSMAILINLLVSAAPGQLIGGASAENLQSTYLNANIADLFGAVFWAGIFNNLTTALAAPVGAGAGTGIIALVIQITSQAALGLGALATWGGLILLIIFGGFLFTFVRLLFLLLNSYIQLIIAVIFGPLILLQEAIPGKSAFGGWVQNILANLVVFPATAGVLIFAAFLGSQPQGSFSTWAPPFVGIGAGGIFHYILSVGVVFLAPNLVAAAKKAFNPQPVLPFSVGTIFAPLTGTAQTGMSAMQTQYYFQQATMHGPLQKLKENLLAVRDRKTGTPSSH